MTRHDPQLQEIDNDNDIDIDNDIDAPDAPTVERKDGHIRRLIKDKGFGFIRDLAGQEFFFHMSSLEDAEFSGLLEGQAVTFQPTSTPKGWRAEHVQLT